MGGKFREQWAGSVTTKGEQGKVEIDKGKEEGISFYGGPNIHRTPWGAFVCVYSSPSHPQTST